MTAIQFASSRSHAEPPDAAAEELVAGLGERAGDARLVVLFAAYGRDHLALNRAVRERLPRGVRLIGASTNGEIDRAGLHDGSVVLGALAGDFQVGLGLGRGLTRDAIAAGAEAMQRACADLGVKTSDLERSRHVGVVIDDGMRLKKEELLIGMLADNPDVVLVGGGASADTFDPATREPLIHVDGEVTTDATLCALFAPGVPFAAMRSHAYHPTGEKLTVTRVDATCTRALEIDGRPAAARYAEIIGVPVAELEFGTPNGFAARPTAVNVGSEYMLRAPWQPLPDGSIVFANLIEEGAELELMRAGDMAEATRRFFTEEVPARVGPPSAALLFHCGGRIWYARATGRIEALSAAFDAAPPCVGFNVAFEIYNGLHVNSTLTALVFGSEGAAE